MRTEKQIREDIKKLNIELATLNKEKFNVGDCFLVKTTFNLMLVKITDVDYESGRYPRYSITRNEFSSYGTGEVYTSMHGYEFSDRFLKISLEKHTELVDYFKVNLIRVMKNAHEEYEKIVADAKF